MKNLSALLCSLSITLLMVGTASADGPPTKRSDARRATTAKPAPAKPVKSYDFTGDDIDGQRIRPDGTTLFGLRRVPHGSLIQLRGDFIPEIARSAEKL